MVKQNNSGLVVPRAFDVLGRGSSSPDNVKTRIIRFLQCRGIANRTK
jgi:hypothetical protein